MLEYVLMYLFSLVVARFLGPALNGTYALFLSAVQFLLVFSSLGLETSLASHVPRILKESTEKTIARMLHELIIVRLLVGMVTGMAFYFFGQTISEWLNAPALFLELLFLLIFYYLCRNIVFLLTSFQIARYKTHVVGAIAIFVRLLEVVGAMVVLSMGGGFRALWLLVTVTNVFQVIIVGLSLREFIGMTSSSSQTKLVLASGIKFWINSLMEFTLGRQTDILLLGYFLVGLSSIGHYEVALGFAQAINFGMTSGLSGLSVASFSSVASFGKDQIEKHFEFLSTTVVILVIPTFVFAVGFAPSLICLIYSPTYLSSVILFQIISVFVVLTRFLAGGIAADYLQASHNTNALFVGSSVSGITNIALAIFLIPVYGTIGAVFATGIAALVLSGIQVLYVQKSLNVRIPFKVALRITVISIVSMMLADELMLMIGSDSLFLLGFYYVVIFVGGCVIVRPLTTEFINYLNTLNSFLGNLLQPFVSNPKVDTTDVPPHHLNGFMRLACSWMPEGNIAVNLGSSTSLPHYYLRYKASCVITVDADRVAMERLRQINADIHLVETSISRLPFASESVDTVLFLNAVKSVSDVQKVIEEVWRILRPRGTLIVFAQNEGLFRRLTSQNLTRKVRYSHFSERDVQELFSQKFILRKRRLGGLLLYPVSLMAQDFVREYLKRDWDLFFEKLRDIDNNLSWGKWSYNIILLAEKKI